jgi:flagellar basal body-associated protein FliL
MGDSTWTHKKRKSGKWYVVIVVLLVVAVAAVIFRNNPELSTLYKKNNDAAVKVPRAAAAAAVTRPAAVVPAAPGADTAGPQAPLAAPTPVPAVRDSVKPSLNPAEPTLPKLRRSIPISGIECTLVGRKDVRVLLSLEVFFDNDSLKDEILLKRKELGVMVQSVISRKNLDEIVVDPLRRQLRMSMNGILNRDTLIDVEFRDFRIEKTKKL